MHHLSDWRFDLDDSCFRYRRRRRWQPRCRSLIDENYGNHCSSEDMAMRLALCEPSNVIHLLPSPSSNSTGSCSSADYCNREQKQKQKGKDIRKESHLVVCFVRTRLNECCFWIHLQDNKSIICIQWKEKLVFNCSLFAGGRKLPAFYVLMWRTLIAGHNYTQNGPMMNGLLTQFYEKSINILFNCVRLANSNERKRAAGVQ